MPAFYHMHANAGDIDNISPSRLYVRAFFIAESLPKILLKSRNDNGLFCKTSLGMESVTFGRDLVMLIFVFFIYIYLSDKRK